MLNQQQFYAYSTMMSGSNCFFTGNGGVGKSYVLDKVINDMNEEGKNLVVTAPTGVAAININGVTAHRAFKIPLKPLVEDVKKVPSLIKEADTVIIDEVSMCRMDVFEYIAKIIIQASNIRVKYGGKKPIQVILCGDFFQLPPVLTDRDREILESHYNRPIGKGFAFESPLWKHFNFVNIVLNEVVRQTDKNFVLALNMTRVGDKRGLRYIWEHCCHKPIENAIMLCGTNKAANEKNESELSKIQSKGFTYRADIVGEVRDSDKVVDEEITLKVGTRVMTIMNDQLQRYQNGSLGTVVGLSRSVVKVQLDVSSEIVEIEENTWDVKDYELKDGKINQTIIGSYTQIPLKLAWAITIHKSQGQTYDAVNLNPYCWDCGQLYVALSRARSLERLFITQYPSDRFLVTSEDVKDFYKNL